MFYLPTYAEERRHCYSRLSFAESEVMISSATDLLQRRLEIPLLNATHNTTVGGLEAPSSYGSRFCERYSVTLYDNALALVESPVGLYRLTA